MLENAKRANISLRPHIKTHKTIEGAIYQLYGENSDKSDGNIIVSTLGEAQFFADSKRFAGILYAVPIVPSKLEHAASLHSQVKVFSVLVDSFESVQFLENFCKKNPSKVEKWNVFVKIDCGYHRLGVNPKDPSSINLIKQVCSSPFIQFRGIYSHSGHSYSSMGHEGILKAAEEERAVLSEFSQELKRIGIECPTVTVGSTPVCSLASSWEGITEIHPGNYIFYDRFQATVGACSFEDVACSVLTCVIGHYPERNRIAIDAGALALSKDLGPKLKENEKFSWGTIRGSPHLKIVTITQECGLIESDGTIPLQVEDYPIGSQLLIIPNHSCLTAACFPKYFIEEGNKIVEEWITCPRNW